MAADCCVFKFLRCSVDGRGLIFDKQVGQMLTMDQNGKRRLSLLRFESSVDLSVCLLLTCVCSGAVAGKYNKFVSTQVVVKCF